MSNNVCPMLLNRVIAVYAYDSKYGKNGRKMRLLLKTPTAGTGNVSSTCSNISTFLFKSRNIMNEVYGRAYANHMVYEHMRYLKETADALQC